MPFNEETAKKAGKKSSRKGVKNFSTVFREKLSRSSGSISEQYRQAFAIRKKLMNKLLKDGELSDREQKALETVNKMCSEAINKLLPAITENKNENKDLRIEDYIKELGKK